MVHRGGDDFLLIISLEMYILVTRQALTASAEDSTDKRYDACLLGARVRMPVQSKNSVRPAQPDLNINLCSSTGAALAVCAVGVFVVAASLHATVPSTSRTELRHVRR
jgi:hypothetical protein